MHHRIEAYSAMTLYHSIKIRTLAVSARAQAGGMYANSFQPPRFIKLDYLQSCLAPGGLRLFACGIALGPRTLGGKLLQKL